MEKSAKIYVAGHRGLVGSALWKNLLDKGYAHLVGQTHAELDLTDQQAVRAFFERERPEYVFLAAAHVGGIAANNTFRGDFIYQNLQIQNNVIGCAREFGVKKLLFLGSTCIYPREAPQPIPEEALLTAPLEYTNEPYAVAKIAGIKLCESFNLQYGTNFLSVMPTNLYGPNDNFHLETSHVLPALLRKIHLAKALADGAWDTLRRDLDRRPVEGTDGSAPQEQILATLARYGVSIDSVEVWGSGRPLREFLWSEEMADACVFVMERVDFADLTRGMTQVRNTHINLGTGQEISIADLVRLIADVVGYAGNIRFNPEKPDGTPRKLTDPSRLHRLGWRHRVDVRQGVEMLYRWYTSAE